MSVVLKIDEFYQPKWLSANRANALQRTLSELEYREYAYRASVLKRAPKYEFYVPFGDGMTPLYRWGQSISEYENGRPLTDVPLLHEMQKQIAKETGEVCNHCIVIEYSDGEKHHAPAHHDRQEGIPGPGAHDMAADSSFFVLSLGYPRLFQLLNEALEVVWEARLAHGSLLRVTADMNRELYHAVPRDPLQPKDCPRYSVIFRTIRAGAGKPARAK